MGRSAFAPTLWRRCAVVVVSLACSSLLALALKPVLHNQAQLLPFTLAVIAASTYGGLIAGLVTTVLSFVIADFLFIEPVYKILTTPADYTLLFVFLIFGISLSVVNHALAKANLGVLERSRQLTQSNQELERFAYSVAHDLQEPLRGIRMFTELFRQKNGQKLDEESARWLGFVSNSADRMKSLIEAILEFSVAAKQCEISEVDSAAVVKSAMEDLRTGIEQSCASIRVGPLPLVSADERQLGRVFLNLIGNAIKYHGEAAPVVIEITAEPAAREWIFSVKDNGPGIDPKYRDRVFETFQRLQRQAPGHGLGLATCKRIIEQHGGRIWVESEPGKGADFRFMIPKSRN